MIIFGVETFTTNGEDEANHRTEKHFRYRDDAEAMADTLNHSYEKDDEYWIRRARVVVIQVH